MLSHSKHFKRLSLLALVSASLVLSACSDDDKKGLVLIDKVGNGEMFHGAEWATIKNLDPRGEQCVDCHGKTADLSPNGGKGHNIGLKNLDTPANLGIAHLKITSATVDNGKVTVKLNQALPTDANPSMTFAKLSPRVRHDRGHDWQNYLNAASNGGSKADGFVLEKGLAPQLANSNNGLQVAGDRKTLTLDLKGAPFNFGEHEFDVSYKSGTTGQDAGGTATYKVTGTKVVVDGISDHISCFVGHKDANQAVAQSDTGVGLNDKANGTLLCWWPDGTALPAGVFVSNTGNEKDAVIVSYEESYTHRITLLTGVGKPAYNTWFTFVPDGTVLDFATYSPEDNGGTQVHQNEAASRDVVDIQSCNSCHDSLALSPGIHGAGGSRSQVQVCVTCHNPGNLQARTGRSVDFKQLIHRIHRGSDLPSVSGTVFDETEGKGTNIAALENAVGGHGLLSGKATDWTKVRFPQGPTPGSAAGVTNCVKCHMGPETKRIVQELATEIGPGADFDVQKELKLAKVTPQGDNWLNVRNVEACRGCHDSQIWMNGNDATVMEASVPLYGSTYLNIGYDWIGFKGANSGALGGKHSSRTIGDNANFFSCGSGGGCHGNTSLPSISITNTTGNGTPDNTKMIGDNGSNKIQRRHLRLTRDFILAERFAIEITDSAVSAAGEFTATVKIKDKKTGAYVENEEDLSSSIAGLTKASLPTGGQLAWMRSSPDYNHSPGSNGAGIPGNPLPVSISWAGDIGTATANLATMPRTEEWNSIKDDFANIVGTVFVQGKVGTYSVQSATADFRFDGNPLASDEGRRKVVDFTAGNGPINLDPSNHYPDWDKADGANTQSCSSCHLQLAYHGGNRTNNVQVCVVCHNAQRTDINSRKGNLLADGQYEESLDFKRLIHAVHAAGGKDTRVRGQKMRIDPLQASNANTIRPSPEGVAAKGHSFPGVLSNCKSCHIENGKGQWTFELDQLPKGMIGSTAITADWKTILTNGGTAGGDYDPDGKRHDFANHLKMTPIASVCSSCHDAGYKTMPDTGRTNNNILDGGPYIGSHWWVMGGIASGIVPNGEKPSTTKHQSGL